MTLPKANYVTNLFDQQQIALRQRLPAAKARPSGTAAV